MREHQHSNGNHHPKTQEHFQYSAWWTDKLESVLQEHNNHGRHVPKPNNHHQGPDEQPIMGESSTTQGMATAFADNANITIKEDIPYLYQLEELMKNGDSLQDFVESDLCRQTNQDEDLPSPSSDEQLVFLDFRNVGTYTAVVNGVTRDYDAYSYDTEEEIRILERLTEAYKGFNVRFTIDSPNIASPASGDETIEYSTILFNAEKLTTELKIIDREITEASIGFGMADGTGAVGVDFLNTIRDDMAYVNANFWKLLVEIDSEGRLLSAASGIPIRNTSERDQVLSDVIVGQSANTGANVLGHNMGLRQVDAMGPPGTGIPINVPLKEAFVPRYDGLRNAVDTESHIMALNSPMMTGGSTLGVSLAAGATRELVFSERSGIKLTLAEGKGGRNIITESEAKRRSVNGIELPSLAVSNASTQTKTLLIEGRITNPRRGDSYRLKLEKGTTLNAEIISLSQSNMDSVVTRLRLYRQEESGRKIIQRNLQIFEPFDPMLIDVPITETGTYIVVVNSRQRLYSPTGMKGTYPKRPEKVLDVNSPCMTGAYWLLLNNF